MLEDSGRPPIGLSSAVLPQYCAKVLTASGDRTAKHGNVESGECLETLAGHRGVWRLTVSKQDCVRVLTTSEVWMAKLLDVKSG